MAKKVQEYWDFKLIKGELDFLGKRYLLSKSIKDYIIIYRKFIESRKSLNACSIANGILKQFSKYLNESKINQINEITITIMDGYIDWLKCAPKTKKNHISVLSQLFDQAIKENIITTNSAKLATLPKIVRIVKHRSYSIEDLNIIFKHAGAYKLYFLYLFHTGLRAGDVATLKYSNIDRSRKVITQLVRKSRRIHEFPLSNALLKATPEGNPNEYLFPSLAAQKTTVTDRLEIDEKRLHQNLSKPRKFLQAILKAADRPHGTLHSFRVTYNNSLRDLGMSIQDRQILLAHSSTSTTQIYTHPNIDLAREYVNKLPKPNDSN